jgi:hypothetical protein
MPSREEENKVKIQTILILRSALAIFAPIFAYKYGEKQINCLWNGARVGVAVFD